MRTLSQKIDNGGAQIENFLRHYKRIAKILLSFVFYFANYTQFCSQSIVIILYKKYCLKRMLVLNVQYCNLKT